MTNRRTNGLVLEMLLHLKIMVVEVVGAKSEGLADATIMSPHPSGPPPTVLIHSKCIHRSPQIGHVLVNCEVMGFAIYVFFVPLRFCIRDIGDSLCFEAESFTEYKSLFLKKLLQIKILTLDEISRTLTIKTSSQSSVDAIDS